MGGGLHLDVHRIVRSSLWLGSLRFSHPRISRPECVRGGGGQRRACVGRRQRPPDLDHCAVSVARHQPPACDVSSHRPRRTTPVGHVWDGLARKQRGQTSGSTSQPFCAEARLPIRVGLGTPARRTWHSRGRGAATACPGSAFSAVPLDGGRPRRLLGSPAALPRLGPGLFA